MINRRHFLSHLSGLSSAAYSALYLRNSIAANAPELRKQNKSTILIWLGGGASSIDMWDLKPGSATGGPFKPINTNVDGIQICEHLPLLSKNMDKLSIIRNMSTREADHTRGRYYMHTGYVPNPNIDYPSYGSVISHELEHLCKDIEIPLFVSIGGTSTGPGFLGMSYAPFIVNTNGTVRDLDMGLDETRVKQRMEMLATIENRFIKENRGGFALDHAKVLNKTWKIMNSDQMYAFKTTSESSQTKDRYGNSAFGRSCLMARRLVEAGIPFIEVDFGGWDNHTDIFNTLENQKLPDLDKGLSALIEDLQDRGLLENTTIICMGEFGRTPNINGNGGRDHWARSWSVVVGGGSFKNGRVVGETNENGKEIVGNAYTSQDLMASVLRSLGISLETTFTAKNGRPMKIANSGKVITELF
jgi:hypothetical protein